MNSETQSTTKIRSELRELHSFDIFDTLVTRRVAEPKGIFAIMQNILISKSDSFLARNFYRIRVHAEDFAGMIALSTSTSGEINLDEIYAIIQCNYNLTPEETDSLKQLEIETEIKNLIPLEQNVSLLKRLVTEGKNVVLISDMYYCAQDLYRILSHIDPVFENIKIYVSSEYRASKRDGILYDIVQNEQNPQGWTHYGDNRYSDIKKASLRGINTVYLKQENLMPYEEKLLKTYPDNMYFQAGVGSARLARMNKISNNQDKYNFGASFAAPILYNYMDWVIQQSLKQGFKTLYFVARDGYVPKLIADIIIEKRNLDIKTKYIHGSRLAWRITLENSECKNLLLSYFKQEIDLTEKNIVFVDIQGTGKTADYAADLLNELTDCTVYSFYLTSHDVKQADNSIKLCYLASTKYHSDWPELLCRTTYGQTLRYEANGDKIEPVTEQIDSKQIIEWGFNEYIDGIMKYTAAMADAEMSNHTSFNTLNLYCEYNDYLYNHLDRQTAQIIGKIPFAAIGSESTMQEAAPDIHLFKLLLCFLFCQKNKDILKFPFISQARSGKLSNKFQKFMHDFPTIQKLLFNVCIHKKKQDAYIRILGIKISFSHLLWK